MYIISVDNINEIPGVECGIGLNGYISIVYRSVELMQLYVDKDKGLFRCYTSVPEYNKCVNEFDLYEYIRNLIIKIWSRCD